MAAPLPVLVARDPLPDPRGRPRLPVVLPLPSTVPGDIDAVAPDVAGATLGCVRGGGECPGAVTSLFPAVREFPVATETAPPGSVCSVTPGSPSDARDAPSGGVTPAATGSFSRAGPVPSAVILAAAEVTMGCLRGRGKGPATMASSRPIMRMFSAATKSAPPGSSCPLTLESPSDAGAAPSDSVTSFANE